MSIEYKPTRWEPQLNCSTHPSPDSVHSVVFGLQATNSETGSTAYIDERIVLDPCLTPEELNERSEELMETWAGSRGFYLQLQKALYNKDVAPRPMPDGYEAPDLDNVSIGDGYTEFVINENNINDQELVEEVFGDALPTPEPTEQPTEDPETPAE